MSSQFALCWIFVITDGTLEIFHFFHVLLNKSFNNKNVVFTFESIIKQKSRRFSKCNSIFLIFDKIHYWLWFSRIFSWVISTPGYPIDTNQKCEFYKLTKDQQHSTNLTQASQTTSKTIRVPMIVEFHF